ncbi:MAG: LytR C-terminal domain-containing protein [Pseudohongiellaceae bacterium]
MSRLDLARNSFENENYGIAIGILQRELAAQPASIEALNGLGASFDRLGRYDVARDYYFQALDLASRSPLTLTNIGYSYLLEGRRREAERLLVLALQIEPDNVRAAGNLQLARMELARAELAESFATAPIPAPAQTPEQPAEQTDAQAQVEGPEHAAVPIPVQGMEAIDVQTQVRSSSTTINTLRLEISNGNGVTGMASRLRSFLRLRGGNIVRLTNADNFGYADSILYYTEGRREAAEAIASRLPLRGIRLQKSNQLSQTVDARLLIGRDIVPYDPAISTGGMLAQI